MKQALPSWFFLILCVLPMSPAAPSDLTPFFQRGKEFEAEKKYAEAVAEYTKAIEADPLCETAWALRGWAQHLRKDEAAALDDFEIALQCKPDDDGIRDRRARVHMALKDYASAAADFTLIAKHTPSNARPFYDLAQCYQRLGKLPEALAAADQVIQLEPASVNGLHLRMALREKAGDIAGALEDCRRALSFVKDEPSRKVLLAAEERLAATRAKDGPAPAERPGTRPVPPRAAAEAAVPKAVPRAAEAGSRAARAPADLGEILASPDALAGGRPGGEILTTKGLMRTLVGPLGAEQEKAFNAAYAEAYAKPAPRQAARHRWLNQNLIETLAQRNVMLHAAREYDAAMNEAAMSEAAGDAEGAGTAREIAALQARMIEDCSRQLQAIVARVDAEPPPNLLKVDPAKEYREARQAVATVQDEALLGRWIFEQVVFKEPAPPKPRHPDDTSTQVTKTVRMSETEARIVVKTGPWNSDSPSVFRALVKWTPPPEVFGVYASGLREEGLPIDGYYSCSLEDDGYEPGADADDDDARAIQISSDKEVTRKGRSIDFQGATTDAGIQFELYIGRGSCMRGRGPKAEMSGLVGPPDLNGEKITPIGLRRNPEELRWTVWLYLHNNDCAVGFRYRFELAAGQPTEFADAAAEQKQAALDEHEENIAYAQKAIEGYRRELAGAPDDAAADRIRFSILHLDQDIQDSRDRIASVKTGQDVHTRGPWEQHVEAVQMRKSQELVDHAERVQQMQASALRMAAVLRQYSPEEATRAHELILRQISTGSYAPGGMDRARQALDRIHSAAMAGCRGAQADREASQERTAAIAAQTARNVGYLESVKRNADRAMMVGTLFTPMGAGAAISLTYTGATVAPEKGPVEAMKQVAKEAAALALMAGAMKGGEALFRRFINPQAANSVDEVFAAAKYREELRMNQALVDRVKESQRALGRARDAGSGAADLAKLESAAVEAVSAANGSTLAKRVMKNELFQAQEAATVAARQLKVVAKNPEALKAAQQAEREALKRLRDVEDVHAGFQKTVDGIYAKVDDAMIRDMRARGYNVERQWFTEYRNASSKGVNCDRDFGLLAAQEKALQKGGAKVELETFMEECQSVYEANYRKLNQGRSAKLADQNITTSLHSESFPLQFLDCKQTGTASREACQRAGKAIYNKVTNALVGTDPQMVKLQKAYASLAKDLKTKVMPRLKSVPPGSKVTGAMAEKARAHWEEVGHVLDDFSKGRIDPLDATRRVRELTGGRSIRQIALDVRKLIGSTGAADLK